MSPLDITLCKLNILIRLLDCEIRFPPNHPYTRYLRELLRKYNA